LYQQLGSPSLAIRRLNADLRSGARIAELDGVRQPKSYWRNARIALDILDPFVERDGIPVSGEWTVSEPTPLPLQVALAPVQWIVELLRGLRGVFGEAAAITAASGGRDRSRAANSPQRWLYEIVQEAPRRQDERPTDYIDRLYDTEMPDKWKKRWSKGTLKTEWYRLK
jgi:hypothetical protein